MDFCGMMTAEEVEEVVSKKLPGAQVRVEDMTGTFDHFQVDVTWSGFQGKSLIEQHRIVHQALEAPLGDGRIHALKIKTCARQSAGNA